MNCKAKLVLLCLAAPVAASAAPQAQNQAIRRVETSLLPPVTVVGRPTPFMNIRDRMAHHKVPAVSIAVIDDHKLAWARAYGTLQADRTAPATQKTLFQAASISKPVAAAAALTLVQRGRIKLDEPINSYLRTWKVPDSEFTKERPVTLRHLLSHSAGLTVHGFGGYAAGAPVPSLTQVLSGSAPANSEPVLVNQLPGSAWRYSGGGTSVAQLMMEDVTQQPFARFMRNMILRPLAMTSSGYEQPLPPSRQPLAAVGHRPDGKVVEGRWHQYPEQAAAGLWTTPTDLARFVAWVMRGRRDPAASAEHRTVATLLTEPQPGLAPTPTLKMGLGLLLGGTGPTSNFWHNGANEGYRTYMIAYPETGQGAVLMTNSDSGMALVEEIIRSIALEYGWPEKTHMMVALTDVAPERLAPLAGSYILGAKPTDRLAIALVDGRLEARVRGGPPVQLWPESATSFVRTDSGTRFRFSMDGAGAAESVSIEPMGGRPVVAKREPTTAS